MDTIERIYASFYGAPHRATHLVDSGDSLPTAEMLELAERFLIKQLGIKKNGLQSSGGFFNKGTIFGKYRNDPRDEVYKKIQEHVDREVIEVGLNAVKSAFPNWHEEGTGDWMFYKIYEGSLSKVDLIRTLSGSAYEVGTFDLSGERV